MQYGCGEIKISPLSRCWYRSRDNEPGRTNNIVAKDVTLFFVAVSCVVGTLTHNCKCGIPTTAFRRASFYQQRLSGTPTAAEQQAVLLVRLHTIVNSAYHQRRCGGLRSTNKGYNEFYSNSS